MRIEATYETPPQYHNAMEPHAIVAAWEGDKLSLDTPSQGLVMAQAASPGCSASRPRTSLIRSPFLGGGFGSKGLSRARRCSASWRRGWSAGRSSWCRAREQMYGPVGHRAPTRQTLSPWHRRRRRLTAIDHHRRRRRARLTTSSSPPPTPRITLYASPAIATSHEAVRLDTGTPLFMRAPGEATGSIALESAIDEMADACGMDPLAFRLKNYAEVEPISGKPFSSKALRECYAQGAERFGWAGRPLAPRQMRDEAGLLVGWGIGTATFPALMFQAEARAVVRGRRHRPGGDRAHDMGQGAWTALAQIAADALGLDIDQIEFRCGPSDLPDAGIAGGSAHTATAGSAIHNAGAAVIDKLAKLATSDERSPLYGAGNAGRRRARRPPVAPRRREPQRELCRYPRARACAGRSRRGARPRPTRRRRSAMPCTPTAPSSPRSRSTPISARSASPGWSAPSRPGG